MSNEDQISAFLKTIPKDCKNSELLITQGIIESDRSQFPILVGNVIPHLTLSIEAKEHSAPAAKGTIANNSYMHLFFFILTNIIEWGGLLARLQGSAVW